MKEGLAIILLGVFVALGWKQSYQGHLEDLFGVPLTQQMESRSSAAKLTPAKPPSSPAARAVIPAPTPDRAWLFGPKPMDKPHSQKEAR